MPEHLAKNKYKKNNAKKSPKQQTPNPIQRKQNNKSKHKGLLTVSYHIMNKQQKMCQKYTTETGWETCNKGSLSIFADNDQVTYMFILMNIIF